MGVLVPCICRVVEVSGCVALGLWSPWTSCHPWIAPPNVPDCIPQVLGVQDILYASLVPLGQPACPETETSRCSWGLPSLSPAQQENPVVPCGSSRWQEGYGPMAPPGGQRVMGHTPTQQCTAQ